jgi:hypothetical protein
MKCLEVITGNLGVIKLPIWESSFCKVELKKTKAILKFKQEIIKIRWYIKQSYKLVMNMTDKKHKN